MSNFNYHSNWYQFGHPNLRPNQIPPGDGHCQSSYQPTERANPTPDESFEHTLVSASVKIICSDEKQNEHKVFMLRDLDIQDLTIDSLKYEVHTQFGSRFVDEDLDFDIGYFRGNKRIWIRDDNDLKELTQLLQTKHTTLWCTGRGKRKSKKRPSESSSLKRIVLNLTLQYRVWAESIVGGRHKSLTTPPRGSYYKKT